MSGDAKKIQEYLTRHAKGDWASLSPQLVKDYAAYAREQTESEWLFQDLLMRDSAILLSGPATVGFKTWLAFTLCLSLASGKAIQAFKPVAPQPVLVIEEEGPLKSTFRRFDWLQKGLGIDVNTLDNFYVMHREHFIATDVNYLKAVCKFVLEKGIKLVVVDTLAKTMAGDENSAHDIGMVMKAFDLIRDAGAAVLFIHHLRKPSKDTKDADIDADIRGSSAMAGYYDFHLAARRRAEATYVDLTIRSNEIEERKFRIDWTIDKDNETAQCRVVEILDSQFTAGESEEAVNVLMPGKEYSFKTLCTLWQMPAKRAHKLLQEMQDKGILHEVGTDKFKYGE